jgi:hypothetical protein
MALLRRGFLMSPHSGLLATSDLTTIRTKDLPMTHREPASFRWPVHRASRKKLSYG